MAVLPQEEISIGNGVVVFFQFLGGAIFLAVSESVFSSKLLKALAAHAPQVNAEAVVAAGAAAVNSVVAANDLPGVLLAYNEAILICFVSTMLNSLSPLFYVLSVLGFEWKL